MIRCPNYGKVTGCGSCSVNIQQDDDLSILSDLSTAMIGMSILGLPQATTSEIDMSILSIKCNGIIRIRKGVKPRVVDTATAFNYNKQFYISLLNRKCSLGNYSDIIASHLLYIYNTEDIDSLLNAASNLVHDLESQELTVTDSY